MSLWDFALAHFRILSGWIPLILSTCLLFVPVSAVIFFGMKIWIRRRAKLLLPQLRVKKDAVVIGLFHPYCNAGGGGERVLWIAIRALQKRYKHINCVVYTGDLNATGEEILTKARQRFDIVLPRSVTFIFLEKRNWVEASRYPYFTLLAQSLGSMVLGWEALMKCVPDIYIDTMGFAFTLPIFKYLGGCRVACYVHYPTISVDMLDKVSQRKATYNNPSLITNSKILTSFKLVYYRLFAYLYGIMGKRCDTVMVNSTWTLNHILALWQLSGYTHVVYPPCNVEHFLKSSHEKNNLTGVRTIVSIAQFRPEKDHLLQIRAFHNFLSRLEPTDRYTYKLVLIGSCRNDDDRKRVGQLKQLCTSLQVQDFVEFKLNVLFEELCTELCAASINLHTMWNEHFGIGVVEGMAAGAITLAHNSGGPCLDILTDYNEEKTGFLADDEDSYASAMETIFKLSPSDKLAIQNAARLSVQRFSENNFESGFLNATGVLLEPINETSH